jgi:hypothetical protein
MTLLSEVRVKRAELFGRLSELGFESQNRARLEVAVEESLKTSEIEGEILNPSAVRSLLAKKMGLDAGASDVSDRKSDGVVEMLWDAACRHNEPLTCERLFGWHAALFPLGYSGVSKIKVGAWRDDLGGSMRIVSGEIDRERVHYEAPPADRIEKEMKIFLDWVNASSDLDPILKAGRAHLWFESIHPFEDGNGRIGRAITEMLLARAEQSGLRFYSLSAQIQKQRKEYYSKLEASSRGDLNDCIWLQWFLGCLGNAIDSADELMRSVLVKARFWIRWAGVSLNERQIAMLNILHDGFQGNLTNAKWGKLMKCSSDTALRDINDLMAKGILVRQEAGGRSTFYVLNNLQKK